jgi:hypothetical protein
MFADAIVDVYRHFQLPAFQGHVGTRKAKFETAIRTISNYAEFPAPTIVWTADSRVAGLFHYQNWTITIPPRAVTRNPTGNLKDFEFWLEGAVTPYHELRHCEQYFLMAQAMVSGALPIPDGPRGRDALPHTASEFTRGQQLMDLRYPIDIVARAFREKDRFSHSQIPQVRRWLDSCWGWKGARSHTFEHMHRSGHNMNAYKHLPEEADAYAVEVGVSRIVRERLQIKADSPGLSRVSSIESLRLPD